MFLQHLIIVNLKSTMITFNTNATLKGQPPRPWSLNINCSYQVCHPYYLLWDVKCSNPQLDFKASIISGSRSHSTILTTSLHGDKWSHMSCFHYEEEAPSAEGHRWDVFLANQESPLSTQPLPIWNTRLWNEECGCGCWDKKKHLDPTSQWGTPNP